MNTKIRKILKNTNKANKKADLEKIQIDFDEAKELISKVIQFDIINNNLQKEFLLTLLNNVKPYIPQSPDYISFIEYICDVIELVIYSAPLDTKFTGINTYNSLKIINRVRRILTGRTYYTYSSFKFQNHKRAEAVNCEWCDDF